MNRIVEIELQPYMEELEGLIDMSQRSEFVIVITDKKMKYYQKG